MYEYLFVDYDDYFYFAIKINDKTYGRMFKKDEIIDVANFILKYFTGECDVE